MQHDSFQQRRTEENRAQFGIEQLSGGRRDELRIVWRMAIELEHAALIGEELALSFADGVEAYLPLPMLRRACPCAVCQGEPDALGRVVKPVVELGPKAFGLLRYQVVGGYALQLVWADGHGSGIFSYGYLRNLAALPMV